MGGQKQCEVHMGVLFIRYLKFIVRESAIGLTRILIRRPYGARPMATDIYCVPELSCEKADANRMWRVGVARGWFPE